MCNSRGCFNQINKRKKVNYRKEKKVLVVNEIVGKLRNRRTEKKKTKKKKFFFFRSPFSKFTHIFIYMN